MAAWVRSSAPNFPRMFVNLAGGNSVQFVRPADGEVRPFHIGMLRRLWSEKEPHGTGEAGT